MFVDSPRPVGQEVLQVGLKETTCARCPSPIVEYDWEPLKMNSRCYRSGTAPAQHQRSTNPQPDLTEPRALRALLPTYVCMYSLLRIGLQAKASLGVGNYRSHSSACPFRAVLSRLGVIVTQLLCINARNTYRSPSSSPPSRRICKPQVTASPYQTRDSMRSFTIVARTSRTKSGWRSSGKGGVQMLF